MKSDLYKSEEFSTGLIAVLAAFLLAANEVSQGGISGVLSSYAYWLVRILIESSLFVATLYALERLVSARTKRLLIYISAIIISLIPFTLTITSVDLIVGLPELGLSEGRDNSGTRFQAFVLELLYLFDNHAVLCSLLLLPRFVSSIDLGAEAHLAKDETGFHSPSFHEVIEPPLDGRICRIEAQEHYIRISTNKEKRMVLYRFSDAVREMPESMGMQVHRSHWVAYSAIDGLLRDGQRLRLRLVDDEIVPVSKSFQPHVEAQLQGVAT